jgi:hypothetical protein
VLEPLTALEHAQLGGDGLRILTVATDAPGTAMRLELDQR